jgi:hypothetical protein
MTYQFKTVEPLSDYTYVGNTSATTLFHAELDIGTSEALGLRPGEHVVLPTFTYYYTKLGDYPSSMIRSATECVLARHFTKGLVLYRTDTFGSSASFRLTNETVSLPSDADYWEVQFDGSLKGPVTETVIGGYEGKIFVRTAFDYTTPLPSSMPTSMPSAAKVYKSYHTKNLEKTKAIGINVAKANKRKTQGYPASSGKAASSNIVKKTKKKKDELL